MMAILRWPILIEVRTEMIYFWNRRKDTPNATKDRDMPPRLLQGF